MDGKRFSRVDGNEAGDFFNGKMLGSPRSVPISSPPFGATSVGGASYILHTVSKFDTLAGVAIKYGVEVSDIKRLNGLVTDLQMFACKTLQIPLSGRHPPSPDSCNGCDIRLQASSCQQTLFDSFPSLKLKSSSEQNVSASMNGLQRYHGRKPTDEKGTAEGFEMAVYWKGGDYFEDEPFIKSSPISDPLPSQPKMKSKGTVNFTALDQNSSQIDQVLSQESEISSSVEKMVRRRQKSEADFSCQTPEKLLKEDSMSPGSISAIKGKGLALRPKSANRTVSESINGEPNPIPIGLGDSLLTDTFEKLSSAWNSQDSENSMVSSIWSDFQALSSVAIARPILDGLAKPTSRRNKAAVD